MAKAVSVCMMQQPPVTTTAVHMLRALHDAERRASKLQEAPDKPFIAFADTCTKYAELLSCHAAGALDHMSLGCAVTELDVHESWC